MGQLTADDRYTTFNRAQIARMLGISVDALDELHERDEGPPRFKASPRRWSYPAADFRDWQRRRLAECAADTRRPATPRSSRKPKPDQPERPDAA